MDRIILSSITSVSLSLYVAWAGITTNVHVITASLGFKMTAFFNFTMP